MAPTVSAGGIAKGDELTAMTPLLREAREAEMPALKSALVALQATDFPERQAALAGLDQAIKKLTALHEESAPAFLRPKAERRPALAQEQEGGLR